MPETERRTLTTTVELRQDGDDGAGAGTLTGLAAVFSQETTIGQAPWGFREQIAPGAFDDALARPDDVRALFNHDPNMLLGRTLSDTLRLSTTRAGLRYEIDLPDTAAARDVRALIARGDVSGSSFGFRVTADEWDESEVEEGELALRTIRSVELFDVSPVTYPAYPQTSVSTRARDHAQALAEARVASRQQGYRDLRLQVIKAGHAALRDRLQQARPAGCPRM